MRVFEAKGSSSQTYGYLAPRRSPTLAGQRLKSLLISARTINTRFPGQEGPACKTESCSEMGLQGASPGLSGGQSSSGQLV